MEGKSMHLDSLMHQLGNLGSAAWNAVNHDYELRATPFKVILKNPR